MSQTSPFKLAMPIRKSFTEFDEVGGSHYFIYGLASGVNVDRVNDRMAESAIHAFKVAIDRGKLVPMGGDQFVKSQLPLRSEHQNHWDDDLGWLVEAEVDENKNLWIKAELDQDNPRAVGLFKRLQRGSSPGRPLQIGLSVGGWINKVRHEFDHDLNKTVRVIEDVSLDEISVTSSPANPATMLDVMRKSLNEFPIDTEESDTMGNRIEQKILDELNQDDKITKSEESVEDTAQNETENQTESSEETAEVTPSDESGDGVVEKSESVEEAPDLQKVVEQLAETVSQMSKRLDELTPKTETEEVTPSEQVQKSETEEVTPSTEALVKSVEEAIEGRLVTALTTAFESFKKDYVDALSEKMDLIKTDVDRIAAEPVDRSSAIHQSKAGDDLSPLERYQKSMESGTVRNPILASVQASLADAVNKLG